MRRNAEAMRRAQERRRREDEAERLTEVVPELESLHFIIQESRKDDAASDVTHKRYIMVARAPALFEIPCSDHKCDEGGHDITRPVLKGLKKGETTIEGSHKCKGHKKLGDCNYQMRFTATATYEA